MLGYTDGLVGVSLDFCLDLVLCFPFFRGYIDGGEDIPA